MADNVTVSAGSGTSIATDQLADTSHVQYVKLMSGTADATDKIAGDATNGLDVDVTRVSGNVAVTSGSSSQVDGHSATLGWTTDAAVTTDAAGSLSAKLRGLVKWAFERMPASLGQKAMSASFPVTLANDQSGIFVMGREGHGSATSGSPVRISALAQSTEMTTASSGSVTQLIADTQGRLVITPYQFLQNAVNGVTSHITDTSAYSCIGAQGAGIKIYLTHIMVSNTSGSTSTWVNLKDGTTTKYNIYAAAGTNTPVALPYPMPLTANTAFNVAAETTGAGLRVSASGYKGQ